MARGVGRGGGAIILNIFFFQGGHYSREAINRGAAIIQANTVYNFLSRRRNGSCLERQLTRRIDHAESEVYIRFQISRRVVLGLFPQPFADK